MQPSFRINSANLPVILFPGIPPTPGLRLPIPRTPPPQNGLNVLSGLVGLGWTGQCDGFPANQISQLILV